MNIAIMFNGELRWFDNFKTSFEKNFKPALAGHNVQYFAHFWNQNLSQLPLFISTCGPMIIELENKKADADVRGFFGITKTINTSTPNQAYGIYKSFALMQQFGNQYDLYIRMRTDLFFPGPVSFDNFDSDAVYTHCSYPSAKVLEYACDFAYFTKNYEAAQKMSRWGFGLNDVINGNTIHHPNGGFTAGNCTEEMLGRYIDSQRISAKFHSFETWLARDARSQVAI